MDMNNTSKYRIAVWLLTGCVLIFLMVVIGGITRLTGSGLSITEWDLVMGTFPPMNDAEWFEAFEKYQQIPQYEKINFHFELEDFKSIFWWEYIHRLLGRLIGLVFIIPFIWFITTRQMDKATVRKSLFLFFLGGLQGFLGWFMVSSGLTERTSVSHIRLAIHLITAFVTFGFTFWYALELLRPLETKSGRSSAPGLVRLIFALLIIQIIYGAFVAGLHAGKMYNTFPLMDGQWIPTGIASHLPVWLNLFDNSVTVQFIHRLIGWSVLILIIMLWWKAWGKGMYPEQRRAIDVVLYAVVLQFLLGILTLLSGVQITLASLHQIGAFFLFSSMIYLLYEFRKFPAGLMK